MPELFFFEIWQNWDSESSQYAETIIRFLPNVGACEIQKVAIKVKEFSPNIYNKMEVVNNLSLL